MHRSESLPYIGGTVGFCIQNRITRFRVSVISFLRKIFDNITLYL